MNEPIFPLASEVNAELPISPWQTAFIILWKVLLAAFGVGIGAFLALLIALFSGLIEFSC